MGRGGKRGGRVRVSQGWETYIQSFQLKREDHQDSLFSPQKYHHCYSLTEKEKETHGIQCVNRLWWKEKGKRHRIRHILKGEKWVALE